jgi:D-glycero-D-manno-heptose 1,7-bisphosphate phosphatase
MKRPAIFFDRDNTLIVSDGYLGDPAGVTLVEQAADAVARARQYGFQVMTFSNQSGVARGMFTEDAVAAVNRRMDELLQAANAAAVIERHVYCPYHPEAVVERYREDSFLRKPKPGMILKLAEELNLDLARSWVVGDAPRDIEAGQAAGCRTVLFRDPKLPASPAAEVQSEVKPDFVVSSLREAIELIAREAFKGTVPRPTAVATIEPEPVKENGMANPPRVDASEENSSQNPPTLVAAGGGVAAKPEEQPGRGEVRVRKLEHLTEQILLELRRRREQEPSDFSVSKLLAGIVQVLALAVLFLAYLNRDNPAGVQATLLWAIALQVLTVALLIMGKQR